MDISLRAAFVVLGVVALLGLAESAFEITASTLAATVAENSPAGTSVTQIETTGGTGQVTISADGDTDPNPNLDWFTIEDGLVTVKTNGTINYEETQLSSNTYTIPVKATDDNGDVKETVTVTITNVNECPSFATDGIIFNTSTPLDKDTEVGKVTATDPDASDQITYGLTGQDDKFSIAATGAITAKVKLSGTETYTMVITAKDDDSTPLTCSTYVVVCVGGCSTVCPNGAISLTGSVLFIAGVLIFIFV